MVFDVRDPVAVAASARLVQELGPMTREYRVLVESVLYQACMSDGYAIGVGGRVYAVLDPCFANGYAVVRVNREVMGLVNFLLCASIFFTGASAQYEIPNGDKVRLYKVDAPWYLRLPCDHPAHSSGPQAEPLRACQVCRFPARARTCGRCHLP